jgi:peptidoglycan/LPS O-acetylase OafA/YrhL
VVAAALWVSRRGRPELRGRRRLLVVVVAAFALVLATTAAWASTHEFFSASANCTAVGGSLGGDATECLRKARWSMAVSSLFAGAFLAALALTARGRNEGNDEPSE